jgi:DNA-directed RNA polymerase specialized sigma24 family protein
MRACWSSIHRSFTQSLNSLQANMAYQSARTRRSALAPFAEPGAVVAFLSDASGDLDQKDNLLATLVTMAQEDAAGDLAMALLWLGLWRGLDGVFRRQQRRGVPPEDLLSSLSAAFTLVVHRLDIDRVTRVAATLLRNTERRVLYERERQAVSDSTVELTSTGEFDACAEDAQLLEPDIARLRQWLTTVVGQGDAALLLRVIVLGDSYREAAAELGLSYENARKRTQRALARTRLWMSQSAPSDRVGPGGGHE